MKKQKTDNPYSIENIKKNNKLLLVISGPSGVGKDAIVNRLTSIDLSITTIVTATTRKRRPYEQEGKHYIFLKDNEFEKKVQNNEFLEWAQVYQHKYGVLIKEVNKGFERSDLIVIKTDIQGAKTIKQKLPESVLIFLNPTSFRNLESHLLKRETESRVNIAQRLKEAKKELEGSSIFDYKIENKEGMLNETLLQLEAIISIERNKSNLKNLVNK
ncbi:MAG: guanylate kinase [Chloroflexi bacterium]|nr:guanylate kinase [Chloroflexota bacterium]|tara:strand:- start:1709 stop:2353 length:645 start_codon:yes stop_codon:yes gene_type:complete